MKDVYDEVVRERLRKDNAPLAGEAKKKQNGNQTECNTTKSSEGAPLPTSVLTPLVNRVRTDVTAIKKVGGQVWTREPLTEARLYKHLNGGPARGVCPIKAGEATTMVGLYDLDSHKGETSWADMVKVAAGLLGSLESHGMKPIAFRSSGGRGIHVFLLWDDPQDAYSVRKFMSDAIEAMGFRNGTAGVACNEIEIFPKQDSVPVDGFGNQFILPLSGLSEPLEPLLGLDPTGKDYALTMDWPISPPVEAVEKPMRYIEPVDVAALGLASKALLAIPNTFDRVAWFNLLCGFKEATGEGGYEVALAWSANHESHTPSEFDKAWNSIAVGRSHGAPAEHLFHVAELNGFNEHIRYEFEDFSEVQLTPKEHAEQVAIQARNQERAERIGQAAIERAQALSLDEIIQRIADHDLAPVSGERLVTEVISELVKSRLGSVDEESALKALKESTGFSLKALRGELMAARRKGPGEDHVEVSAKWPVPTARAFLKDRYMKDGESTLRHWQDEFLVWDEVRYQAVSPADIRSEIYAMFERHRIDLPGRGPVDNTLDALKALANVSSTRTMPSWLCAVEPAPAGEVIPMRNGLLHVPTRELLANTPRFFTAGSVDVAYTPDARHPAAWLKFLADAFPNDVESIEALQQWFGYLLTQDTRQQKALICVGPKRCGKGTIARVLRALLGEYNCTGPSLGQLGGRFGLQGLIGKAVAIISDARVGGASDLQAISENLLRITGEDGISVERKNMIDWDGKLTTRFVLMTNILPGIVDAGGAVASRFIVLRFTQSFYGREDPKLTDKLMDELPGILNWALEGLANLHDRGAFIQPASGTAAVEELIRKTTPILGFVSDTLAFDADSWISKDTLYAAYRAWCEDEGMRFTLQKNAFFGELYTNTDGRLVACEPRVRVAGKSKQLKSVRGARLAEGWADRIAALDSHSEGRFATAADGGDVELM